MKQPRKGRKPRVAKKRVTQLPDEHAIPEDRMTHIERINGTHPNPAAIPGQGNR